MWWKRKRIKKVSSGIILLIFLNNTIYILFNLGVEYVSSVDLHISTEYINKTYKSCSQASFN